MSSLERVKRRLLGWHPGAFQPDDYLARWCSPPVAELFDTYGVRLEPVQHVYVEGIYGPRNCIKNALAYAAAHPAVSPWWAFALYWDDDLQGWLWWLHSFCTAPLPNTTDETAGDSSRGGVDAPRVMGVTLYDPTIPPQTAPVDAPVIFYGLPWGIELYREFATATFNPDTLPPFLKRSIFSVLHTRQTTPS